MVFFYFQNIYLKNCINTSCKKSVVQMQTMNNIPCDLFCNPNGLLDIFNSNSALFQMPFLVSR